MIRLVAGAAALVSVWFGLVEYEEFQRRPIIFTALALIVLMLSLIGSFASKALNARNRFHAAAFALPFSIPTGISALAIREDIYRPFFFWACITIAALIVAFASDRLVFAVFKHGGKKA